MNEHEKKMAGSAALLMREVLCELVYQGRAKWDPEHPCKALELRTITPETIVAEVAKRDLEDPDITAEDMRHIAATVLAQIRGNSVPWHCIITSEQPDSPVPELVAGLQELLSAIDSFPEIGEWASDDLHHAWSRVRYKRDDLRDVLLRAYEAVPPTTLADVVGWIGRRPPHRSRPPVWWGRLGEGKRAFACDGHAILVVDRVEEAPADGRWFDPIVAERTITGIERVDERDVVALDSATLVERIERAKFIRVGAAVYDSAKLRIWVSLAARVDGGDVRVGLPPGPHDNLRIDGAGWHAIVMPLRFDPGDKRDGIVDLLTGETLAAHEPAEAAHG